MFSSLVIIMFFSDVNILLSQCIDTADFSTWTEANTENNWQVVSPMEVSQNIEIFPPGPAFFVSDHDFINIRFSFDIVSMNGLDNDFIGFVVGYRNPFSAGSSEYEFILFDWKARAETAFSNYANEGFSLAAFHGNINSSLIPEYFWGHNGLNPNSIYEPLAHSFGEDKGWETGRTYHFEVFYMTTSIKILIDGNLLFDIERCNQAGRIGFYTYSQHQVVFSNLYYKATADLFASPETICAGDTVFTTLLNSSCPDYNTAIENWQWNWGDGQMSSNQTEDYHIYPLAGNYNLELIAEFPGNCRDTVSTQISVQALPVVDLGPDTIISPNTSIMLTAGDYHAGWTYLWSNGSDLPQITLDNLDRDTVIGLWVASGLCQNYDEITIKVEIAPPPPAFHIFVPNAFSPNGDGLNDVFLPITEDELQYNYQLYIYDRWGTEIFRSAQPEFGWNGTYKGQKCPGDVYEYLIKYQPGGQFLSDEIMIKKGCFLLLR